MKITQRINQFLSWAESRKYQANFWAEQGFAADNNMTYGTKRDQKFWSVIYQICLYRGNIVELQAVELRDKKFKFLKEERNAKLALNK